jgi:hypothetical protein
MGDRERFLAVFEDTEEGRLLHIRLEDGTELSGHFGRIDDEGNVTLAGPDADHVIAVDEVETLVADPDDELYEPEEPGLG